MSGRPTYLFGVGATKAGTTWLFRYLAGHPDCHLRSVKELHYFDSLAGGFDRQITVNSRKLARVTARIAQAPAAKRERLRAEQRDLADWLAVLERRAEDLAAYRGYLEGGRQGQALVADITPSYAELAPEGLRRMAAVSDNTRFVYLLRDPVSRFWSHVRMVASRMREGQSDFAGTCDKVLRRVLAGEPSEITKRSDYRGALGRMQAALDPARLLVMFQDHMMTAPGLARLCGFLGIAAHPADTSARVHEGAPLAMTAEQKARIRAFLQPQYDFVANAFPDMPESWRANLDGVTA